MKLIIDISEEDYKRCTVMASAIRNGIPLDDVIGKIDKAYDDLDGYDPSALGTFANRVSDILDNIGKESAEMKKGEPWETK